MQLYTAPQSLVGNSTCRRSPTVVLAWPWLLTHVQVCVWSLLTSVAGQEVKDLERRLHVAKEQLAKLEASKCHRTHGSVEVKCAASVKELHSKWEAAKTMYRERVSEVESETEDWLRNCHCWLRPRCFSCCVLNRGD